MATYLDTSVIITRYMPTDPNFRAIENFFSKSLETRYISEISVFEMYCLFSRLIRGGSLTTLSGIRDFDGLSVDEKVRVAVEHAIRSWRLRVAVRQRSFANFPISNKPIEVEHEIFQAIRISPKLALKALDTLHLAYAHALTEHATDLDTLTTLDREIISRGEEIQNELGIRVVNPLKGTR